ncbi:hypothetical protein FM114_06315 [Luteococcus japonicus LSP_Lj1]|uniref:Uncharacterized protein n=1 Tax=Luteococcus japonicus LSP_Lj1 TaxID=1255658 RepID=A0A1R4J9V3_9ACTN|nr:hypothetical protein FM114_06315 [Luteococcus japonicus LSP_Lj1]
MLVPLCCGDVAGLPTASVTESWSRTVQGEGFSCQGEHSSVLLAACGAGGSQKNGGRRRIFGKLSW